MKETLLVITARNISGPLLAELAQWLGSSFTSPEHDDADNQRMPDQVPERSSHC